MGHKRRPSWAGMFHVTTRSINEELIFRVENDFVDFVTILPGAGGAVHAFCVMPTHYHVLATFAEGELSAAIHLLNRRYASRFNRRHARRGHVFDSPYASVPVESEGHLLCVARYIAQNPPRPRSWPWSSFVTGFSFVDETPLIEAFGSRERMLVYVFETHEPGSAKLNQVRTG